MHKTARTGVLFCFSMLLAFGAFGQNTNDSKLHLSLGGSLGGGIGWWIHDYGLEEDGLAAGYARTHFVALLSAGGEVGLSWRKWEAGINLRNYWMDENRLLESSDRRRDLNRVAVSETWVKWMNYHFWLRYAVVKGKRFRLAPHLGLGNFNLVTTHPEAATFNRRLSWEIGLDHEFALSRLKVFFRPQYSILEIWPDERRRGEKHKIFGMGAQMGLRYQFF